MKKDSVSSQLDILRSKRYVLYWFSSLLSNIGTWMQQVAQPWIVLSMSHSSMWVGIDSFAMNAPAWIFTLWGGVLADRQDRKKLILIFQGIQWLCVMALVFLLLVNQLQVWMIVLISFFVGLTDSLSMPSFQSIIPSLVKSKDIPKAVALNSAQFNLSRILGPAIAGFVIARYGATICFEANAISYIPFFLSLYWIYPKSAPKLADVHPHARPVSQVDEYKAILIDKNVRLALYTVLVTAIFCAQLITFCPVLIKDIFHSNADGFGWAMASFGIGGFLGAASALLPFPQSFKRDRVAIITSIALGLTIVAVAFNRSQDLLLILLSFAGAMLTISNVNANSFLQQISSRDNLGRMASLYQLALHCGMSVGALLTGFTIAKLGVANALALNGAVAVLIQILILSMTFLKPRVVTNT